MVAKVTLPPLHSVTLLRRDSIASVLRPAAGPSRVAHDWTCTNKFHIHWAWQGISFCDAHRIRLLMGYVSFRHII
jgi:hypothetical protein